MTILIVYILYIFYNLLLISVICFKIIDMTTLNIDESNDFDTEKYFLATELVDLMTRQFSKNELIFIQFD